MTVKRQTQLTLNNPPVVETGLSIQFSELPKWETLHHGLFYLTLKERFSAYEHTPAEPPIVESFPITPRYRKLGFKGAPTPERAVYLDDSRTASIAVQQNRFSFNWSKGEGDAAYPSYEVNRETCRTEFESFLVFCQEQNLGEVQPRICEVMYQNHIYPSESQTLQDLFSEVFGLALSFEALTLNRTFLIEEDKGRLYSEINSIHPERPFLSFKLSSRVRHTDGNVMDTMQTAHDELLAKFCELTSEPARKGFWGQV